jgi:VanZ family protein
VVSKESNVDVLDSMSHSAGFDSRMTKTPDLPHQPACAAWSNRILILSLLGIGYLTLFPFQFRSVPFHPYHGVPFLLGSSGKRPSAGDFFLNILLFVPFGFAVASQVRKRGGRRLKSFLWALALGAFLSYTVEFVQLYTAERDSGWEDVISNTTGSVVGFFVFEFLGIAVLEELSRFENWLLSWLTPRRAGAVLLAYFAVGFGISALLQNQTRLSNWDPRCVLFVGNDASGKAPWAGKVLALQIWNRALREEAVRRIAGGESPADEDAGLIADYDFARSAPYQDRKNSVPALDWTPAQPQLATARAPEVGPGLWLSTQRPVENLTQEIRKTSQFSVRIVCAPDLTAARSGRIVSLSQSNDNVNFHLRQYGGDLVFYFRNPLSETRSMLAWTLPGVFSTGNMRDIVAVYDGSDAFLYVDGNAAPRTYRLSPGATVMHRLNFIVSADLQGYVVLYHTLLFLPAGLLLGIAARKRPLQITSVVWLLALGWALPAVSLEMLLAFQSGRRIWVGNIGLSLIFSLLGMMLINADWPTGATIKSKAGV